MCRSLEEEEEEEGSVVDWRRQVRHLPLLHVLTKQDQAGPSLSSVVGEASISTSARTGLNVETVFLLCCSLARPHSLHLQLSLSTSPAAQQSADIRPSRLFSQNKCEKIIPKLTPVQPPLSPAAESIRWENVCQSLFIDFSQEPQLCCQLSPLSHLSISILRPVQFLHQSSSP